MKLSARTGRALVAALTASGLVASVSGCGGEQDERPTVVAAFYPLAFVAEQVVGDTARVRNLTLAGQEPHDLELGVQETAEVAGADTVFYEKGFQPAVDEAVGQNQGGTVVDATSFVGLAPVHDEHAHEESEHADEAGDPHLWLDPTLLAKVTQGFSDAMAEADPENADGYRRNGRLLRGRLAQLDRDYRAGLETCRTRTVVVSHDAFGYLGRRYDLDVVPIAGISPDAEPSARRLAELRTQARQAGVTTIFSETLASPELARTLAREVGVDTAVLDPLEGLAEGAQGDYLGVMRANLAALQKANGCT